MFNKKEENERKKILGEISRLKEENKKLLCEIDEIEKKDEINRSVHGIGENKKLLYWGMPVNYLDSVFYTRKKEIGKDNVISMADDMHSYFTAIHGNGGQLYVPQICRMAVLCEEVIKEDEGFRLVVSDPYRKVVSNIISIEEATAYSMPGKILYLDCNFEHGTDKFYIKRWKKTDLTLNGYKGSFDPVINSIAKAVLDIKDIKSEEEAVSAVTALQNYILLREKDVKVARFSPTEVRILQHTGNNKATLYGIEFKEDRFWFFEEPGHEYIVEEHPDVIKELYESFNIYQSVEFRSRQRWAFTYRNEKEPDVDYE